MEEFGGQEVTVAGWVRSIRDMKNFGFVVLNDGSCFKDLQVVMNREKLANYEEVAALTVAPRSSSGARSRSRRPPAALRAAGRHDRIEGAAQPDYPMQKKRQTREFLRTQQHLRSRTNLFRAVFRVRSVAAFAIHRFFQERGFVYVNTPIITASDAEGAGEMFRVTTIDPANPPLTPDGKVDYSKDFLASRPT